MHFRPEFVNRIDEFIVFQGLRREQIKNIVTLQVGADWQQGVHGMHSCAAACIAVMRCALTGKRSYELSRGSETSTQAGAGPTPPGATPPGALSPHTTRLQARRVEKRLADKKMKMEMDESGEGRHGALFHAASALPAAHTDSSHWLHFQQHHGTATCAHGHICVPAHS